MRENLTDITFILDRSGSMAGEEQKVTKALNDFITEQRNAKGDANFTLVQFDSQEPHEVIFNHLPIQRVGYFDKYEPRAGTPLYDCVGKAIDDAGKRFLGMKEKDRPARVVFVVLTDGWENASTDYKQDKIKEMIEHQKGKYNWQFIFLGADLEKQAFKTYSGGMGNASNRSVSVSKSNIEHALKMSSGKIKSYRGISSNDVAALQTSLDYTEEEQDELQK